MKNDMKIIMEGWRKKNSLIKEQEQVQQNPDNKLQTVGDLKKIIKIHRLKSAGKEAGKKAAEMVIEQIPIVNNLFSLWKGAAESVELIKKLYGANDEFQTNTGMDALNIPDDVSKIVDDKIENAFINHLLQVVERMDDSSPIPNSEEELKKFLKMNFHNHSVEAN